GAAAGDAQRQARHFKWGLKKWVLDWIFNTDYTNVAQVAAAARNIELLHENGNANMRDRDGNRVQNRGQGQQEIRVKQSMSTNLARLPPTIGRVYATTRGQAAKTSGTI
nr:zinc finger, CCHC-type, retrotransposon Gag domain protein [Tanacetum cinerariifolium]